MKTLHKHAEWIKLWADGEELEYRNTDKQQWNKMDKDSFMFSSVHQDFEFRIKPEPEFIPFDFDHAKELLGRRVVSKKSGSFFIITIVRPDEVVIGTGGMVFAELLDKFTFEDGSPCGLPKSKEEQKPTTASPKIDLFQLKTFKDVCKLAGHDPGTYSLPKNATDDQVQAMAFRKLQLIYRVFNQGWYPDWTNSSEGKYYPWFSYSADFGFSYQDYIDPRKATGVGACLCTNTVEKAKYIGKTFIKIYNEFLK